ncbi:hypothetical protein [Lysinibacillus mangiferihumi]|nr:hypothetical protein [Lysinibacillus mangiferihumi]
MKQESKKTKDFEVKVEEVKRKVLPDSLRTKAGFAKRHTRPNPTTN